MKIHEILGRDPRTTRLANNGQARILNRADENATAELRAELETFVCEGRFSDAMERIIGRYLPDLDSPRQSSVWVSGFFGSGKSHLLKMLTHLWKNTTFGGGSNARNIVSGGLPDEIEDHLRELDTQAKRTGKGLFAAEGTLLGGNERVRATVLSIVLQAGGWPEQYPTAMFCFWLRDRGWLDTVRSAVEESGRDWLRELNNLYVSPYIARALLQVDKDFAPDEKSVRQTLLGQFPQLSTDITTNQFVEAAKNALGGEGDLPLTLIVLDEVQQYIGESVDRAAIISELAEALQTQFDSRVMLVCAGQSALEAGTPNLQRLLDRFVVRVQLTDQDVEAVTRRVLLRKKSPAIPKIEAVLVDNAGEVAVTYKEPGSGNERRTRKYVQSTILCYQLDAASGNPVSRLSMSPAHTASFVHSCESCTIPSKPLPSETWERRSLRATYSTRWPLAWSTQAYSSTRSTHVYRASMMAQRAVDFVVTSAASPF